MTGRKREGREKERKRDGGSEKLTLSFPESTAYSFKNLNDSHWESTKPRPERGYTRTHDAFTVHLCVVNIKMNLSLEKLN